MGGKEREKKREGGKGTSGGGWEREGEKKEEGVGEGGNKR